ncbi:MAG: S8 family serine peptidase, partial [Bacteroidota bacterium]|nr:S8 family serine peptidase [Bacteroidota bacterium]
MKKTFFLLIIVAWQVSVFAQAYIGNKLYDELLLSADDSFIPVNIYLSKQLDVDSLHQEFRDRKVPVHQRAKTVMHKLQQLSGVSQKNLLQFINKEVGQDAKNLRSFWIINMVSVKAKPEMIFRIAERKDVAIIELNSPRLKIEQPVKILNHAAKQRSTAEPGLIAINAHKLWAMGYTGKNRVGMNVDTGVNFKHPAISNNYLGKYLPIDQCWFPFNNPTPYDISDHSHGTHTIGTMMGLDPATNDTIGAAYNAHWISSDPIVSDLYYLRTLPEVMSSFEWALNPDGDTATVFDMPDVINNSWGWVDPPDTFQCNSPYTAVMDVCEAAGIAVVFSAGNDGELGAGTVGEPALKAKNLVNAFAVGSVNANIPSLQISIFSSRGPTVCADTGSLQIKPEVVAPGQDVRSAMGQNDYGMLSGTSMAGPHVAGAILLLKEAFPFLSGEEIKLALYFSAVDLGPVGEDNTYGNGIIDVLAAYNFLSLTYTPVSPVSNNWELVLDEIIS